MKGAACREQGCTSQERRRPAVAKDAGVLAPGNLLARANDARADGHMGADPTDEARSEQIRHATHAARAAQAGRAPHGAHSVHEKIPSASPARS